LYGTASHLGTDQHGWLCTKRCAVNWAGHQSWSCGNDTVFCQLNQQRVRLVCSSLKLWRFFLLMLNGMRSGHYWWEKGKVSNGNCAHSSIARTIKRSVSAPAAGTAVGGAAEHLLTPYGHSP